MSYPVEPKQLIIAAVGLPGAQGSKRHVGNGVMVESSKKVGPWRDAVCEAAIKCIFEDAQAWRPTGRGTYVHPPFDGPLDVTVTFTLPKPKSAPKRRATWPARLPDVDKLLRSTFDALTSAGVWRDDAQVVQVTARKAYPGEHYDALTVPGAVIRISRIGAES